MRMRREDWYRDGERTGGELWVGSRPDKMLEVDTDADDEGIKIINYRSTDYIS